MPYVQGPAARAAMTTVPLGQYDELGFINLGKIGKAIGGVAKKVASPLVNVAKELPVVGGFVKAGAAAVNIAKPLFGGKPAQPATRVATSTITAAAKKPAPITAAVRGIVSAGPAGRSSILQRVASGSLPSSVPATRTAHTVTHAVAAPVAITPPPVLKATPTTSPSVGERLATGTAAAKRVTAAGSQARTAANAGSKRLEDLARRVADLSQRADAVAAAGDAIGAQGLRNAAAGFSTMAQTVAAQGNAAAEDLRILGAGAEGAAHGAVAGAGMQATKEAMADHKGLLLAGAAAIGVGLIVANSRKRRGS